MIGTTMGTVGTNGMASSASAGSSGTTGNALAQGGRGIRDVSMRPDKRHVYMDLTLDDGTIITYVVPLLILPILTTMASDTLTQWQTQQNIQLPHIV